MVSYDDGGSDLQHEFRSCGWICTMERVFFPNVFSIRPLDSPISGFSSPPNVVLIPNVILLLVNVVLPICGVVLFPNVRFLLYTMLTY